VVTSYKGGQIALAIAEARFEALPSFCFPNCILCMAEAVKQIGVVIFVLPLPIRPFLEVH